ncbi:heavy metal-binding protein HIP-like isoform X1 [Ruditapes philippinarum]|uniref:heavy metal-binding protein HIP-like isoform X1 n=1 Tax=Ruditapes philippinarum TaxID=129788 RepID=UPI00295B4888|nr:heavy metal-binding protein HIP-like isoform X1 [Ruditapes philippinarum]
MKSTYELINNYCTFYTSLMMLNLWYIRLMFQCFPHTRPSSCLSKLLRIIRYVCVTLDIKMRISFCKIIFLSYLLSCVMSEEPHCSKYDFEEKVLEKMVRMEFQMERMKSEIDTNTKEMQILKGKTDQIVTPTVAFKARLNVATAAPVGQAIVFPRVLFNEGDVYSSQTGKFTAATNGTYLFNIALCVHGSKYLHVDIMVDGVAYTRTIIKDTDNVHCHTADTVAVLKTGQNVWVQPSISASGNVIYQASTIWNTFSGVLIHK